MEYDAQAALAEFQGDGEQAEAPQTQQAETEVEYYDLPFNGQNIKLPLNHEIPLYHNGTTQNVPLSKLFNGYRNSAHLESKQKELKERMAEMQPGYEEYSKYKDSLLGLQKWSEEKPDEFQAIWDLYQNRQQHILSGQNGTDQAPLGLSPDHPLIKQVAQLTEKLNGYDERWSKQEQVEREAMETAQVAEVETEISQFKEEFKHIDLDERDPEGISLRGRILQFGIEKNYPTFRAAALEYKYGDGTPLLARLLDTAKTEGRNNAVKAVKMDNRNGILSRSSIPQGQSSNLDVRRMSEDARSENALSELTAMLGGNKFDPKRG